MIRTGEIAKVGIGDIVKIDGNELRRHGFVVANPIGKIVNFKVINQHIYFDIKLENQDKITINANYVVPIETEKQYSADNQKIIIEKKGKEVTAKFFSDGVLTARAKSTCHEEDRFDFETGAKLAFTRLIEKEEFLKNRAVEKELLNMKFLCCSCNTSRLTKHKVYEIKDGKFIDDSGSTYPLGKELYSEEDLKEYFRSPIDPKRKKGGSTYCTQKVEYIKIVE